MIHCDDDRLSGLLALDDHAELDGEVSAHLDQCVQCRSRLVELAGGPAWWDEAGAALNGLAANPDPLLYRTAVRRRWPVRFFEPPA